ncbi:TPA: hypothetical protein ACGO38_001156 [Streptococcus suis]|nr:hypothetical protein [Streptococcus suis]
MSSNALLTDAMCRQNSLIEELKNINERNVQATNARFDELETYQKIIEDDVAELKSAKKPFWKR